MNNLKHFSVKLTQLQLLTNDPETELDNNLTAVRQGMEVNPHKYIIRRIQIFSRKRTRQ